MRKIIYLASAMLIIGCGKDIAPSPSPKEEPTIKKEENEKFSLNKDEENFSILLAEDDLTTYLTTEDESQTELLIKEKKYHEIIRVSSKHYQKTYNDNEVKGDSLYLGKKINVKGTVLSIDKSLNDIYSVKLEGTDGIWRNPRAIMKDDYIDWMAELKKGQKISLVCNGGGLWAGNAMLKDCTPAEVHAKIHAVDLYQTMLKESKLQILAFSILYYGLKDRQACIADFKKCTIEVEATITKLNKLQEKTQRLDEKKYLAFLQENRIILQPNDKARLSYLFAQLSKERKLAKP